MAEVWVYAEPKHGTFPRVTFEMLAAARRMAEEAGGELQIDCQTYRNGAIGTSGRYGGLNLSG